MKGAEAASNSGQSDARARDLRSFTYDERIHFLADAIVSDEFGSELKKRAHVRKLAAEFGLSEGTLLNDLRAAHALLSKGEDLEQRRRESIITTQRIRDIALDTGEPNAAVRAQQHIDSIAGVLRREAPAVQVNIIQQNEAFRRLWEAMGEALKPYPEAAAAVQARFQQVMAEMTGSATASTMRLPGVIDVEHEER